MSDQTSKSQPTRSAPVKSDHSSSGSGGHGWWPSWLGGAGTAAISIAALVLSFLAYLDQHSSNESAAIADQQAYASKVTFWLTNDGSATTLNVQNASTAPVADVEIVVIESHAGGTAAKEGYLVLGNMPPCVIGSWRLSADIGFSDETLSGGGGSWGAWPTGSTDPATETFDGIDFTDANAVTWQRLTDGKLLQQNPGITVDALSDPVRLTKQAAAPSCS